MQAYFQIFEQPRWRDTFNEYSPFLDEVFSNYLLELAAPQYQRAPPLALSP